MTLAPPLDDLLSAAVVAYLGWNRAHMPGADEGAVVNLAQREDADPSVLLRAVHEAIDASDRLEVTDLSASHDGGAALYKQRLRATRPDLSPDAVDALASRWFFKLRWLGVESGIDVPRCFVRYGGEGRRTMRLMWPGELPCFSPPSMDPLGPDGDRSDHLRRREIRVPYKEAGDWQDL